MRGKAQDADRGDERGTQKSQGAACRYRPTGKADQNTAQAVGLYAPPPGGHGVLDHRQANRPGKEYSKEALWDDERADRERLDMALQYIASKIHVDV